MTAKKTPKFRRRRKLINYKVQLLLMGHTLLIALLTVATMHLLSLNRSVTQANIPLLGSIETDHLWWVPVGLMFFSVLWGFVLSNRMVGPIYNLQKHLEAVHNGEVKGPARCRNSDYFSDLFIVVNKVLAKKD